MSSFCNFRKHGLLYIGALNLLNGFHNAFTSLSDAIDIADMPWNCNKPDRPIARRLFYNEIEAVPGILFGVTRNSRFIE